MFFRIVFFLILLILATSAPLFLFVVASCVYVALYTGYELIFLGLFIDALYGQMGLFSLPYYTVGALVCVLLLLWVKPRLLVYNR